MAMDVDTQMADLYKATLRGQQQEVIKCLATHKKLLAEKRPLTLLRDTVLHIAAYNRRENLLIKLLETFSSDLDTSNYLDTLWRANELGNTVLHEVAATGSLRMAKAVLAKEEELVKKMPTTNVSNLGEMLLSRRNDSGETPLFTAALFGRRELFDYLASQLRGDVNTHLRNYDGTTILHVAILGESYDMACQIVQKYKYLATARDGDGLTGLHFLASISTAFPSGSRLGIIKKLIYKCIPNDNTDAECGHPCEANEEDRNNSVRNPKLPPNYDTCWQLLAMVCSVLGKINHVIWDYFGRGCPFMKEVWIEKKRHESALRLAKFLVTVDNSWQFSHPGGDPGKITTDRSGSKQNFQNGTDSYEENPRGTKFDIVLLTATKKGIIEIVKEILDRFPQAAEYVNDSGQNILHIASKYRRREIFDLVASMKIPMARLPRRIDNQGNTILHCAAWLPLKKDEEGEKVLNRLALAERHPVQLEPGPALQLQAELHWFKHVKKVIPAHFLVHHNPLTAQELFTEAHRDLLDQGKKWLKRTAESCSLVAVLFATVAFAAAYTVPGGSDQSTGLPILLNDPFFLVFTVTDVMSLASSLTAVVMFLSILTSPFQEQDFRESLPWKLTLGFTFLFISISTMMLTFATTVILTLHLYQKWVVLVLYSIAYLPVTIFALLQYSLYVTLARTFKLSINILKKAVPHRVAFLARRRKLNHNKIQ